MLLDDVLTVLVLHQITRDTKTLTTLTLDLALDVLGTNNRQSADRLQYGWDMPGTITSKVALTLLPLPGGRRWSQPHLLGGRPKR